MSTAGRFDDDLMHDEQVVWRGSPGTRLLWLEIVWFVFGLIWVAILVLPIVFASSDPSPPSRTGEEISAGEVVALSLFWIIFAGFGLLFMVGPYLIRRSWTRRTVYLLTDHRAISITSGRHRTVHAEFLRNVPALNKRVHSDGSGSIAFGNVRSWSLPPSGVGFLYMGWHMAFVLMFWEIPDVENVYALADRHRRERLRST